MAIEPPAPTSISPEAQALFRESRDRPPLPDPEPQDEQGWQFLGSIASSAGPDTVEALTMATTGAVPTDVAAVSESCDVDGSRYYVAMPEGHTANDDRVLVCIHGGAWLFGGGAAAKRSAELLAGYFGVRTWSIDYRQLPDHPFPAGLDDCIAVYRSLLETTAPERIAVLGQSAGANLAAALLLRARDEGLPLPAAGALISPPSDLRRTGDSYTTNGFTTAESPLGNTIERYRGGVPLDHPYLSPLFGTFPPPFPPIILTSGTRDFLLSDTVRLHRRMLAAGVKAELHVWEGAPHGMFGGHAPEDREQIAQLKTFFDRAWRAE
jgi:acetyl esterase/lipase